MDPICQFTYLPIVLVANANAPYKSTKELIAYAKEHPGKVKFAHPGLGTDLYMMLRVHKIPQVNKSRYRKLT